MLDALKLVARTSENTKARDESSITCPVRKMTIGLYRLLSVQYCASRIPEQSLASIGFGKYPS